MTKATYDKYTYPEEYVPKHAAKLAYKPKHAVKQYSVYRVLGPAGPEQKFTVYGTKAAEEAIRGCWD